MSVTKEGPTPLGGTRSVGYLFAQDGSEVEDPAVAVRGEMVEFGAEGDELGRTYFELGPDYSDSVMLVPPTSVGLTESGNEPDLGNDGPKETWDIWHVEDGVWEHPARTMAELAGALGWDGAPAPDMFRLLANFISLPVWGPAPDELKAEVYSWLESNRQE